jgi:hypothetical protein
MAEFHIRDRGNDLREERPLRWILLLFETYSQSNEKLVSQKEKRHTFRMPVTEGGLSHVGQFNVALRARVHELVAMRGVELCRGNDFCQLLHVDGFDVDDI